MNEILTWKEEKLIIIGSSEKQIQSAENKKDQSGSTYWDTKSFKRQNIEREMSFIIDHQQDDLKGLLQ